MPQETVLIRIVTAANMAGVKEARAGFLGMNPAILAAGIALAILVKVGKDATENIKSQEDAFNGLSQALNAYNSHLGKTTKAHQIYIAGTAATVRHNNAAAGSSARLKIATDAVALAQQKLNLAIYWYGATNVKTMAFRLALERANLRLASAEGKVGTAVGGTAAHYVNVAGTQKRAAINLEDYTAKAGLYWRQPGIHRQPVRRCSVGRPDCSRWP